MPDLKKSDIDKALAEEFEIDVRTMNSITDSFLKKIHKGVAENGGVDLHRHGTYILQKTNARPERQGRNPSTGEAITIKAKPEGWKVKFKPWKAFNDAIANAEIG